MKGLCSHDTGRDGGGCPTHRCIWSASSFGALVVVQAAWKNRAEDAEFRPRYLGGSSPFQQNQSFLPMLSTP